MTYELTLKRCFFGYKYDEIDWEDEEDVISLEDVTLEEIFEALEPFELTAKDIENAINSERGYIFDTIKIGEIVEKDVLYISEY